MSPGLQVDLVVERDHDEDGQPEGEAGGHDGVGVVHYELALLRVAAPVLEVLGGGVPLQEDRQEGDAGGREPGQDDHQDGRPHRDQRVVDKGPRYGIISTTKFGTSKYSHSDQLFNQKQTIKRPKIAN